MKWQDLNKIGKGLLVMNELIKELADTAHKQAYEIYTERLSKEKADQVIFYDIFNQKFTELIIEECCDIIAENEYNLIPGFMHRMTAYAEMALLKKHFGVEQ